jgi:hypothetical protein
VDTGAAFEMEVVQQIHDHVAGGGDHIDIPRRAVGVDRRGAAAIGQER